MASDQQVKRLKSMLKKKIPLAIAAAKAGLCENTARKYRDLEKFPSEMKVPRNWKTHEDVFAEVWEEMKAELETNPHLEGTALFQELQRRYPGKFQDGQQRTFLRRVKAWKGLAGPPKEVFFPQKHFPGRLSQSDFTHMDSVGITLGGQSFPHLLYHFVLTYSNWEWGSICFAESFESLSAGLQKALWELGKVPKIHQTDQLGAAVKIGHPEEFNQAYQALLGHYGLQGQKTQAAHPNENGDVEQRHYRFVKALEQALIFRGHRDFVNREEYEQFLQKLWRQLNANRTQRWQEELAQMRSLPTRPFHFCKKKRITVGKTSTIRIQNNIYSVDSRLIGEEVDIYLKADALEVWYAQRLVDRFPRLRGEEKSRINYRHIIDWLVRKPGAFENYRYREDLFPTSRFRMAYDLWRQNCPARASQEYVKLLYLAAKESETQVDDILRVLLADDPAMTYQAVETWLVSHVSLPPVTEVSIPPVDLAHYDHLYLKEEASSWRMN